MVRELYRAFWGRMIWNRFCRNYSINSSCVTIVLAEDHAMWNECALRYLPAFMERKSAKRALILIRDGIHINMSEVKKGLQRRPDFRKEWLELRQIKEKEAEQLLSYYTLFRFSDNLVFFYINRPQDNRSEFTLRYTGVTMDELICLGLYRLREVPQYV